jgi:hypothetical protein
LRPTPSRNEADACFGERLAKIPIERARSPAVFFNRVSMRSRRRPLSLHLATYEARSHRNLSVIKNKLDACAGSIRLHSAAHRVAAMLGSWPHGLGEAKPMTWPARERTPLSSTTARPTRSRSTMSNRLQSEFMTSASVCAGHVRS